mmetsp:Transcript_15411/g.23100  ORF Transcript_15411/g.23100 Transcript_15411/m.23100 type:complete len:310 (+) Transcript_15411:122-1051(+)
MRALVSFYILVASALWTAHSCYGKLLPRRTKLTWVNGIAHMPEHMSDPTFVISTIFGGVKVDYCHNPSSMTSESDYLGFVKDGIQASTHVMMGRLTPEVDSLVEHLRDALKQVGRNGRVIHIAHSQGSVITWLAAQRLKPEECKRIEIISFGGAATICTSEFPFARCINYYSVNDPILNVVPSAVKALKSGFSFGDGMQQEIIFLASRTGDPATDHGLLNPTYLEALVWEGQRYQSLFLSPLGQMAGAAFVAPLSSTVTWFPNFAYEMTRRAFIAMVRIFSLMWELVQVTITRLLGKGERYDPILLKTS